jgi:hypothetical protein
MVALFKLWRDMQKTLAAVVMTAAPEAVYAIEPFTPLTAPATSLNTNEDTNPFLLPDG